MNNFLKCLPCLFMAFFVSCSLFVAGTTEETNAIAGQDKEDLSSSSIEISLSSSTPASSSSQPGSQTADTVTTEPTSSSSSMMFSFSSSSAEPGGFGKMNAAYWYSFCMGTLCKDGASAELSGSTDEAEEGHAEGVEVAFDVSSGWGIGGVGAPDEETYIGAAIRVVSEDGEPTFSEILNWTKGVCFVLSANAPVWLKIGLDPYKMWDMELNTPKIQLVAPGSASLGNLIVNCKSWDEFKQEEPIVGDTISGREAFEQMESLIFEVMTSEKDHGIIRIYDIFEYGLDYNMKVDGMDVYIGSND